VHDDDTARAFGCAHDGLDVERSERAQIDDTDVRTAPFQRRIRSGDRDVDHRAPRDDHRVLRLAHLTRHTE